MNFKQFGFPEGFWQIFGQKKAGFEKHSYARVYLSNECFQETSYFRSKQIFLASNLDSIPT